MPGIATVYESKESKLQDQLDRAAELPFYRDLYAEADVDVSDVSTVADIRELPFITPEMLAKRTDASGRGPFYSEQCDRVFMTPAGEGLIPTYFSECDWERMTSTIADHFHRAGVDPGDLMLNCTGYNLFLAGLMFHDVALQAGSIPVPTGAGNSEQAANVGAQLDVDGIIAFPSFAEKIANTADLSVDTFVSSGEPVIYYPERRKELKEMFEGDTTVVDLYGIAEAGPLACECKHENGMHIDPDHVVVEVIDPETEEPVELGEPGELVVTHLNRVAMPMVRLRTGDVTKLVERECDCGMSLTLPEGVFGRVDNRVKVKGVKVFPDAITPVLARYPGMTGEFLFEISRPEGSTDRVKIVCETDGPIDADEDEISTALKDEILVSPDVIEFREDVDTEDPIIDERKESIT